MASTNANPHDVYLAKQLSKMLSRIERILFPPHSLAENTIAPKFSRLNSNIQTGQYFEDISLPGKQLSIGTLYFTSNSFEFVWPGKKSNIPVLDCAPPVLERIVKWNLLEAEIIAIISNGDKAYVVPSKIREEIDAESGFQMEQVTKLKVKEKLRSLQERNGEPVFPGRWRKDPYPPRKYEPVTDYAITTTLSNDEAAFVRDQLNTPLNGFLGQAYNYDDHNLTENWMTTFKDSEAAAPSTNDVIRTQLVSLMDILLVQVQDRVCTEQGLLQLPYVGLGANLKEVPVWGIDSYTRRMLELSVEDRFCSFSSKKVKFSLPIVQEFIQKRLLPAINAQLPAVAHNMLYALYALRQDQTLSEREKFFTTSMEEGVREYPDLFRIHPKGTGVVCTSATGIAPHRVISEYLGEAYPPFRWCERQDVIEQAQKKFELKPALPDFYNILLERPRQDPRGYGLLFVDASQKANMGSSCSHSCNANCTSAVVARGGKLVIVLTTNRHVYPGEELTMDYFSFTTSDVEWRAAICLCGMASCRGSFLHYATQDDLQQVLNQRCGSLWRYAALLKACSPRPVSSEDKARLDRHGMKSVVLGENPPDWMVKYASDNLGFVEFERKALPCALLRRSRVDGSKSLYSYSDADMDARMVMEQRIQSLVCCFSLIQRIAQKQPDRNQAASVPVLVVGTEEAVGVIWDHLSVLPKLLDKFLLVDSCHKEKVQAVVAQLSILLAKDNKPLGLLAMKKLCLDLRAQIVTIENLSTPKARLWLLTDVLVLWANTTQFSRPQEYEEVESAPITVLARELGNNIHRTKIFKPEVSARRRVDQPSPALPEADAAVTSSTATEVSDGRESPRLDMELGDLDCAASPAVEMDIHELMPATNEEQPKQPTIGDDLDSSMIDDSEDQDITGDDKQVNVSTDAQQSSISTDNKTKMSHRDAMCMAPDEPVYMATRKFPKMFTFWQLIEWFNACTDQKVMAPDLFGCVQLPEPAACFDTSESNYEQKQRDILYSYLHDEKMHMMPWPATLKNCFSQLTTSTWDQKPTLAGKGKANQSAVKEAVVNTATVLMGSPLLDEALGGVDAVTKVLMSLGQIVKKRGRTDLADDQQQFDNLLPPELPIGWVQCDACKKWRRVAFHIDANALPDEWTCKDNHWNPELADCSTPSDYFDPDRESTLCFSNTNPLESGTEELVLGAWYDVYCVKNKIYYEGQAKDFKTEDSEKMVKFHFKGWSSKYDEWMEADNERIQPHYLYTDPQSRHPGGQEKWQGAEGISSKLSVLVSKKGVSSGTGSALAKKIIASAAAPKASSPAEKEKKVDCKPKKPKHSAAASARGRSASSAEKAPPVSARKQQKRLSEAEAEGPHLNDEKDLEVTQSCNTYESDGSIEMQASIVTNHLADNSASLQQPTLIQYWLPEVK